MRFAVARAGSEEVVERDAYAFLRLLVAREADFAAEWTNRAGQRLSVDLLLGHAGQRALLPRTAGAERRDHSYLHLVEVLLAYHRRAGERPGPAARLDPEALQRSFVAGELARRGAAVDDEALCHYAESLGRLVAEPAVLWDAAEAAAAARWLRYLEEERFLDLERADVELPELTHLLVGLRGIRTHAGRLVASPGSGAAR
jgi:hypothetical protein